MKIFFLVCETKDVYIFLVELDAKNVKDRGGGPLGQIYLVSYFFFLQLTGRGGGVNGFGASFLIVTTNFSHNLNKIIISSHSLILELDRKSLH